MQNDIGIIYDGKDVAVRYRTAPGQEQRAEEVIKVRKCPAFEIGKLAVKWGKEMEEVCFYAGKDEAWAKSITDESYEAVLEEGRSLNSPSVTKYFGRAKQTLTVLGQGDRLDKTIEALVQKAGSVAAAS